MKLPLLTLGMTAGMQFVLDIEIRTLLVRLQHPQFKNEQAPQLVWR